MNTSSSIMTEIVDKVAFSNYLPLMTRATADDGEPTPGYMLEEIENAPHCNRLVGYLLQRLGRQSSNVKLKVMKIMHHLVIKGHVGFRVLLRRNDGHIKISTINCMTVPFNASKTCDAVAQAAENLLQVLFDPELLRRDEEGVPDEQQTKLYFGSLGSQGLPQGKYEGFGNSPVEKETLKGKVMDYFEKLLNPSDDLNSDIKSILYSSPGHYRPPIFEDDSDPQKSSMKELVKKEAKAHIPGKAGGGWETDEEDDHKSCNTNMKLQILNSSAVTSSSESIERLDILTAKENTAEAKFVESFCETNTIPVSTTELDRAMKQCGRLDGIKILQSINNFLIFHAQSIVKIRQENGDIKDMSPCEKSASKHLMLALLLLEWFLQAGKVAPEISSAIMKPGLFTLLEFTTSLPEVHTKTHKLKLVLGRRK